MMEEDHRTYQFEHLFRAYVEIDSLNTISISGKELQARSFAAATWADIVVERPCQLENDPFCPVLTSVITAVSPQAIVVHSAMVRTTSALQCRLPFKVVAVFLLPSGVLHDIRPGATLP